MPADQHGERGARTAVVDLAIAVVVDAVATSVTPTASTISNAFTRA
jgi:hypothetical protein